MTRKREDENYMTEVEIRGISVYKISVKVKRENWIRVKIKWYISLILQDTCVHRGIIVLILL